MEKVSRFDIASMLGLMNMVKFSLLDKPEVYRTLLAVLLDYDPTSSRSKERTQRYIRLLITDKSLVECLLCSLPSDEPFHPVPQRPSTTKRKRKCSSVSSLRLRREEEPEPKRPKPEPVEVTEDGVEGEEVPCDTSQQHSQTNSSSDVPVDYSCTSSTVSSSIGATVVNSTSSISSTSTFSSVATSIKESVNVSVTSGTCISSQSYVSTVAADACELPKSCVYSVSECATTQCCVYTISECVPTQSYVHSISGRLPPQSCVYTIPGYVPIQSHVYTVTGCGSSQSCIYTSPITTSPHSSTGAAALVHETGPGNWIPQFLPGSGYFPGVMDQTPGHLLPPVIFPTSLIPAGIAQEPTFISPPPWFGLSFLDPQNSHSAALYGSQMAQAVATEQLGTQNIISTSREQGIDLRVSKTQPNFSDIKSHEDILNLKHPILQSGLNLKNTQYSVKPSREPLRSDLGSAKSEPSGFGLCTRNNEKDVESNDNKENLCQREEKIQNDIATLIGAPQVVRFDLRHLNLKNPLPSVDTSRNSAKTEAQTQAGFTEMPEASTSTQNTCLETRSNLGAFPYRQQVTFSDGRETTMTFNADSWQTTQNGAPNSKPDQRTNPLLKTHLLSPVSKVRDGVNNSPLIERSEYRATENIPATCGLSDTTRRLLDEAFKYKCRPVRPLQESQLHCQDKSGITYLGHIPVNREQDFTRGPFNESLGKSTVNIYINNSVQANNATLLNNLQQVQRDKQMQADKQNPDSTEPSNNPVLRSYLRASATKPGGGSVVMSKSDKQGVCNTPSGNFTRPKMVQGSFNQPDHLIINTSRIPETSPAQGLLDSFVNRKHGNNLYTSNAADCESQGTVVRLPKDSLHLKVPRYKLENPRAKIGIFSNGSVVKSKSETYQTLNDTRSSPTVSGPHKEMDRQVVILKEPFDGKERVTMSTVKRNPGENEMTVERIPRLDCVSLEKTPRSDIAATLGQDPWSESMIVEVPRAAKTPMDRAVKSDNTTVQKCLLSDSADLESIAKPENAILRSYLQASATKQQVRRKDAGDIYPNIERNDSTVNEQEKDRDSALNPSYNIEASDGTGTVDKGHRSSTGNFHSIQRDNDGFTALPKKGISDERGKKIFSKCISKHSSMSFEQKRLSLKMAMANLNLELSRQLKSLSNVTPSVSHLMEMYRAHKKKTPLSLRKIHLSAGKTGFIRNAEGCTDLKVSLEDGEIHWNRNQMSRPATVSSQGMVSLSGSVSTPTPIHRIVSTAIVTVPVATSVAATLSTSSLVSMPAPMSVHGTVSTPAVKSIHIPASIQTAMSVLTPKSISAPVSVHGNASPTPISAQGEVSMPGLKLMQSQMSVRNTMLSETKSTQPFLSRLGTSSSPVIKSMPVSVSTQGRVSAPAIMSIPTLSSVSSTNSESMSDSTTASSKGPSKINMQTKKRRNTTKISAQEVLEYVRRHCAEKEAKALARKAQKEAKALAKKMQKEAKALAKKTQMEAKALAKKTRGMSKLPKVVSPTDGYTPCKQVVLITENEK